jgi:ethanolamine utilization protein EutP (predicted NTPase)
MKKDSQASYGGVGDAAVMAKTGRGWQQWFKILDQAGAKDMPHKAIAAMLAKKYKCPPWWSQMVTVGYEQARGRREVHQKLDGYAANISKTFAASLKDLYEAWEDATLRETWLGKHSLTVRKATARKSMRITWADGKTNLDVNFLSKGANKSQIAVEHSKLASAKDVARWKSFWGKSLDTLKSQLES